jgi:hypothetical protein
LVQPLLVAAVHIKKLRFHFLILRPPLARLLEQAGREQQLPLLALPEATLRLHWPLLGRAKAPFLRMAVAVAAFLLAEVNLRGEGEAALGPEQLQRVVETTQEVTA